MQPALVGMLMQKCNLTISHVMVYSDVIALIYFSCCHALHKILEVPKCQKRCIEFCCNNYCQY